jgi:hypothetical protein
MFPTCSYPGHAIIGGLNVRETMDAREDRNEPTTLADAATAFADALRAEGFALRGMPIFDDRIHRIDVADRPGRKDGTYRAMFTGGRAIGWFQDWSRHDKPVNWHSGGGDRLTREQRDQLRDAISIQRAQRTRELAEKHELAAQTAEALWAGAEPALSIPTCRPRASPPMAYGRALSAR